MTAQNKTQQATEDTVQPAQPGEKLRQAREAAGLSAADIAVRLKLSADKINALECGDIADIATPVFVAGYIRTYARLLDLSETEVLEDFDELLPMQESEDDPALAVNQEAYAKVANEISSQLSLREKPSANNLLMIGLVAVVLIAVVYWLWPTGEVVRKTTVTAMNSSDDNNNVTPLSETMPPTKDMTADGAAEENRLDESVVEKQDAAAEQTVENKSKATLTSEPEPTKTFEPVPNAMKSELVLSFNSDSWAEVQDARGKRLVYRLGKSGSQRAVTGLAPFVVQLGFVQGVDIIYNGAPYDLSRYANRRSVRLRIGKTGDHMSNE